MKYGKSINKLCILSDSLGSGGAERSAGLLSKALVGEGFDVHTIIFIDDVSYGYEGSLYNLGKLFGNSFFQKLKKYAALKKYLRNHRFDFVLDFRMKNFPAREVSLNLLTFRNQRCINMVRSGNLDFYFPKPGELSKALYEKYHGINAVSKGLQTKLEETYGFKNVFHIPSPLDFEEVNQKSEAANIHKKEFIIGAGRMDLEDTKQFEKLINAYAQSSIVNDLDLLLLGEGENKPNLQKTIKELNLEEKVHLLPFQNPFPFFKQAKFFVLTSKYEGFPRVIIESLACGTPVVTFDCDFGPSEVVITGYNGILVEDQDFEALVAAMQQMQTDQKFYASVKSHSFDSVERFDLKKVGEQWKKFLQKESKKR